MPPTATASPTFRLSYSVYAWFVLVFAVIPVAIGCLLLPGLARRRRVAQWGAAALLTVIGSRVAIRGRPLTGRDVAVVVANHQSYLDGIILTAVLPPHYTFLIKREMVKVPVAGFVLSRLGSQFVDRSNARQRHRSARRLVETARRGQALAVFPEGTFDGMPGLKPFRMGAFRAAFIGQLSVVPIVITGARRKLPSNSWLPRPGPLQVEFGPRLEAGAFNNEVALMQATRREILARLDEPDLGEGFDEGIREDDGAGVSEQVAGR